MCVYVFVYCMIVISTVYVSINVYLLLLGKWSSPNVTGDRPPPINSFTLTSITNDCAILFGGSTPNGSSNNTYIVNFSHTSVVSVLLVMYCVLLLILFHYLCVSFSLFRILLILECHYKSLRNDGIIPVYLLIVT